MPRSLPLLLALATLYPAAQAQYAAQPVYPAGQQQPYQQSQPSRTPQITVTQPAQGVWLRSDAASTVKTLSASADSTEIRVERGLANIEVSHAAANAQILVDLPGGQTSLIKDGLYTFNAATNTIRVLRGEADAYLDASAKPVKVKEDHQVTFGSAAIKSVDVDPRLLASDILPGERQNEGYRNGDGYAARGYGYGPYGDGYYGYPVAPYPYYGYGFGYPYGYGYPFGVGLGFGYYGGFGGGFRGGFRR